MQPNQGIAIYRSQSSCVDQGVYPPHLHPFHEMIYVEEGAATVTLGEKKFLVQTGDLLLLNRLVMHDIYPTGLPYRRICIQVSPEFWQSFCSDSRLASFWMNSSDSQFCSLSIGAHKKLTDSIERLFQTYRSADSFKEAEAGYYLGLFSIELYRTFPQLFSTSTPDPHQNRILEAKQYIERHCKEAIRSGDLAKQFYWSEGHFTQTFKKIVGTTPKQYQMLCRLAEARNLLLTTSLSVSDIAFQLGFRDANGFIRFFRQEMRLTPRQFRRQDFATEE